MAEAFRAFADVELGPLDGTFLQECRRKKNYVLESDDAVTAYCRILLEELEPAFKNFGIVVIEDFPPELTALCHVENAWAKRFEIYIHGVEICNAFQELTSISANTNLFSRINRERQANNLEAIPSDTDFLSDISNGLPPCSGIALGLDRWLAILSGQSNIQSVCPFTTDRPFIG